MEPRSQDSSIARQALLAAVRGRASDDDAVHNQARRTTVLTKYAQTAQQNACDAGATHTKYSCELTSLQRSFPEVGIE